MLLPSLTHRGVSCEVTPRALKNWNPQLRAEANSETTISILDVIGQDDWTGEGVTSKRIAGALRGIGNRDVTVVINSPGGDLFEGIAIYNLLKEHPGQITTKVIGMAASAASVIAMAGDQRLVARTGFLMIHNAWVLAMGNRHELRAVADSLEPFDNTLVDLYAESTGLESAVIADMLDSETWIAGGDAVSQGFATGLLSADERLSEDASTANAAHRLDLILARSGMPRSERRKLLSELKTSMPGAAGDGTRDAAATDTPRAIDLTASLAGAHALIQSLKGIQP